MLRSTGQPDDGSLDGKRSDISDRPIDLLSSPDSAPWGIVPDCLAPYPDTSGVPAGTIVVPVGNIAEGFEHVHVRHSRKIAALHQGMSVGEYLRNVLRHYQEIYRQADGSLVLLRTNGVRKCAVLAPVMLDGVPAYKLITAYPLPRLPDFARRGAVRLRFA